MNSHDRHDFSYRPRRTSMDALGRVEQDRLSLKTLSSEALFNGAYEIGINHAGALYRLKITRQGKLILNK
jgi:hemin uptake protein HemP